MPASVIEPSCLPLPASACLCVPLCACCLWLSLHGCTFVYASSLKASRTPGNLHSARVPTPMRHGDRQEASNRQRRGLVSYSAEVANIQPACTETDSLCGGVHTCHEDEDVTNGFSIAALMLDMPEAAPCMGRSRSDYFQRIGCPRERRIWVGQLCVDAFSCVPT